MFSKYKEKKNLDWRLQLFDFFNYSSLRFDSALIWHECSHSHPHPFILGDLITHFRSKSKQYQTGDKCWKSLKYISGIVAKIVYYIHQWGKGFIIATNAYLGLKFRYRPFLRLVLALVRSLHSNFDLVYRFFEMQPNHFLGFIAQNIFCFLMLSFAVVFPWRNSEFFSQLHD